MGRQINNLKQYRSFLHEEILFLRAIEYIINGKTFSDLYKQSNKVQRSRVEFFIKEKNKKKILNWIRTHPSIDYGEMPLARLKQLASEAGIVDYSRMSKSLLISYLKTIRKG